MKYRDLNGNEFNNDTFQDKLLKRVYSSVVGRAIIKPLTFDIVSNICGAFLNSKFSRVFIIPFIKGNNIDMSSYEKGKLLGCGNCFHRRLNNRYYGYTSYNDFFTRKIKKSKRDIGDSDIVSPSDGKVSCYKISDDTEFEIKNSVYSVASILKSKSLAEKFKGGYAVVIRLSVDDYHRYCYCTDGKKSADRYIRGVLHTVNPAAFESVEIFKENSREYCLIKTAKDIIVQMEVGALMVGRISNNDLYPCTVTKGNEKGCFEFGGSTIVLFIQKGRKLCHDFLKNTDDGFETIIKQGENIAD